MDEARAFLVGLGLRAPALDPSHRLRRIYEAAEDDIRTHQADGDWERLPDAIELRHTIRILQHWRSQDWLVVGALKSAGNYRHDLTLMAAATYVAEAGNRVTAHESTAPGPPPDMWIHVDTFDGPIEHKAPETLDEPASLTRAEADVIVANALQRSADQIAGAPFAFVSIGGFRMGAAALDELQLAGERHFATGSTSGHVAALLAFSVGLARRDLPGLLPGVFGDRHPNAGIHARLASEVDPQRYGGIVAPRFARNDHYTGPVPIRKMGDARPGFYLPRR